MSTASCRIVSSAFLFFDGVLSVVIAVPAYSQVYPNKPVRLIVPLEAGGSTDVITRVVAAKLGESLGQQLVVENRPGAGTTIGAGLAAKATPDGYSLFMCAIGSHGIAPALYKSLPYDHIRDFAPISMIGTLPNVLVVHPSLPVTSVGEFVAYAKANPGKILYGSSGVGTSLHLSMEWLKAITGIDIVHVPYKGGAPTIAALLGGQVMSLCTNVPGQLPHIKSGKVRALAVTTSKRNAQLPDVPTMIESGVPDFEVTVWYGICAPANVPKAIVAKLNAELTKVLNMADLRQRLGQHGLDPAPSTAAEFAAFIQSETLKWAKVIKTAGIKPQ